MQKLLKWPCKTTKSFVALHHQLSLLHPGVVSGSVVASTCAETNAVTGVAAAATVSMEATAATVSTVEVSVTTGATEETGVSAARVESLSGPLPKKPKVLPSYAGFRSWTLVEFFIKAVKNATNWNSRHLPPGMTGSSEKSLGKYTWLLLYQHATKEDRDLIKIMKKKHSFDVEQAKALKDLSERVCREAGQKIMATSFSSKVHDASFLRKVESNLRDVTLCVGTFHNAYSDLLKRKLVEKPKEEA